MGSLIRIVLFTVISSTALAESETQCTGDDCWSASSMLQKRKLVGKMEMMVKEEFDQRQASTNSIPHQGDGKIPLNESLEEESLLQSALGDAPPFAKGICQPTGILTPNECCPNGYESILNIELCKKAVVFTGPDFDPEVKVGPVMGHHRPVPFLGERVVAMHIEGAVRPQWNQWTMGKKTLAV
jgi:hypothetical protein